MPLVFTLSQRESLHTTFAYDRSADTWRLTIDDITDEKSDRFGDVIGGQIPSRGRKSFSVELGQLTNDEQSM